jgi:hypothetical protein
MVTLAAAALAVGVIVGHLIVGAVVAGLAVAAWLATAMRVTRLIPAGPRGDGPAPPGGASVREPRRRLPVAPVGAAVRPRDEDEPPGQAVALT